MRKKTYSFFLALAVVVVIASLAISIGIKYPSIFESLKSSVSNQTLGNITDVPQESHTFTIHFFDVGEADSSLVECDGHYLLIDGGNPGSSSFLYSYLQQHGIDFLDYIVCTHAHADHVGGLAGALNYAKVGIAYAPVTEYDSRAFYSFVKYLNVQGKEITVPSVGEFIQLGAAEISFIGPVDMELAESNHNNASIVLKITFGSTSFLFMGDAEIEEENSLLETNQAVDCTLLKVGHHGSHTSSSEAFLKVASPEYAVISVGKDNEYGHPHEDALERIQKNCGEVYRTDVNGEILCTSDGKSIHITFAR